MPDQIQMDQATQERMEGILSALRTFTDLAVLEMKRDERGIFRRCWEFIRRKMGGAKNG